MGGVRIERLRFEDAPEVCKTDEVARLMGIGINYANQLVNDGLLVNIGTRHVKRVPKLAVQKLLEDVAYGRVKLPPRRRSG